MRTNLNSNRLSNKPLTSYQQLMLNTFFQKQMKKPFHGLNILNKSLYLHVFRNYEKIGMISTNKTYPINLIINLNYSL